MPQPPANQSSLIFVSYRRDDAAGHAGRLSDKLGEHFGRDEIFMDIDNIQPGEDFVQVIENAVGSCQILIAIIGQNWLSGAAETSRLLDNPNDFVRLEIAAALNRDIRVIPVLVQRATMPEPQDLPEDLMKLSRRHAFELTDARWQRDVDQLISAIEKIRGERRIEPPPGPRKRIPMPNKRWLFIAAAVSLALIVIAAALFGWVSGWTTEQQDAEDTNRPSENTNTSSATNGPQTEQPTHSAAKEFAAKGNEGSITGTVGYNGTPPRPRKISSDADPACGQKNPNLMTEDTVVTNGKLANVFVYIKEGTLADGSKFAEWGFKTPADVAALDQNGCVYKPHVSGVMVNQTINITNSDPTQHNVHFTPKNNPNWNQSQPNGAAALTLSFDHSEIMVPVKCNQHPWMKAYIGVMKHPFFAVSAKDGSYTIKGVPPGTYTIVAWKEGGAIGTESVMKVTVAANAACDADFSFGWEIAAGTKPGLKMMTALDVHMLGRSSLHPH
jgi:plastocyanin